MCGCEDLCLARYIDVISVHFLNIYRSSHGQCAGTGRRNNVFGGVAVCSSGILV